MAKIVIMGAGIGGITQAYELRRALGKKHQLVVVNDGDQFEFTPSNPWVAVAMHARANPEAHLITLISFALPMPLRCPTHITVI